MSIDPAVLPGIHHVTAIGADAQQNHDFYVGVLGLRLIKVTVNFDDPGSYHLYYGDYAGRPGTAMTFFIWPGAPRGVIGAPQVAVTSFAVPTGSLAYWRNRLVEQGVPMAGETRWFGEAVVRFRDPDDMVLAMVEQDDPGGAAWENGSVPAEHALRGFHSVAMASLRTESTARLLMETMGFTEVGEEEGRRRFRLPGEGLGRFVDLLPGNGSRGNGSGTGVVHHVAFRVPDDAREKVWQTRLQESGMGVSPVMDRQYFHSIYFREPGGILFEIATDGPGFTADEAEAALGQGLMLPAWMEPQRSQIEASLPPLKRYSISGLQSS